MDSLGDLPRNAPDDVRKMRKNTSTTIAQETKRLVRLRDQWAAEEEANVPQVNAGPIQDPRYYGPIENRPILQIQPPVVVKIRPGECFASGTV
jgi:hypothetical protein